MAKQTISRKSPETSHAGTQSAKKTGPRQPSHDAIAARAFEIFLSRGAASGCDVSDWLRAENELKSRAS
jgi:hypothetical protein